MITSMGSGLQEEEAGVVTVSLLVTDVSLLWLAPTPDSMSGGVRGGRGARGWQSLLGGVVPIWIERGIEAPPCPGAPFPAGNAS